MKQGHYTEKELQSIFTTDLSEDKFEVLDVRHIVHLAYQGEDYYIMLRSVSHAGNPHPAHRFRAQLPRRPYLDAYKSNSGVFIFLGYVAAHDVYVMWNPFNLRPCLNEKESVSLFCELSTIERAQQEGFVWNKLPNGGLYVTFTPANFSSVLYELSYFKTEVTIPSKNESISIQNDLDLFVKGLIAKDLSRLEMVELCMESFSHIHSDWSFLDWRKCVTKIIELSSE